MRAAGRAEPDTRPRALASLTPQQLRVARHVAEGRTNREVAALLTLSHRTVDHHLRNVFATLGIRSRVQLVHALAPGGDPPGA
ncbi:helix-turn-helix transcriptional regulator [Streptomyces albireticuli]|nr:helix-turn-helix transcriptional regulator [Streptomyces albireticuli]